MTSTPSSAGPEASSDPTPPTGPATPPAPSAPTGPRVTAEQVRDLGRLRRTVHDRKIAGVAGGIARHLDIDPVIMRVAFVVLTLFGGAGLIVYAACWILLPEDGQQHQPLGLDERSRSVALVLVGILGAALLVGQWDWFWVPGPLILVALVVWLVMSKRNSPPPVAATAPPSAVPNAGPDAVTPEQRWAAPAYERAPHEQTGYESSYQAGYEQPPAPPQYATMYVPPTPRNPRKRGPKLFWFTMALAALAVGVVSIVDLAGAPVAGSTYAAVVVGVVGVMLVVGAFYGRAGGLILIGLLASVGTAIGVGAEKWDGEHVEAVPTSASQVLDSYEYKGLGEYTVDLTRVTDLEGLDGRTIHVSAEVGELDVILPSELDVDVIARVDGPGGLTIFGNESGGIDTERTDSHDGGTDVPELTLDIELDAGHIDVRTR